MRLPFLLAAVLVATAPPTARAQAASAPPAPPTPAARRLVCDNYRAVMLYEGFPREAMERNLETGSAVVQFTLTAEGEVTEVRAIESTDPVFAAAAIRTVEQYRCRGIGRSVKVRVPFQYRLEPVAAPGGSAKPAASGSR